MMLKKMNFDNLKNDLKKEDFKEEFIQYKNDGNEFTLLQIFYVTEYLL